MWEWTFVDRQCIGLGATIRKACTPPPRESLHGNAIRFPELLSILIIHMTFPYQYRAHTALKSYSHNAGSFSRNL